MTCSKKEVLEVDSETQSAVDYVFVDQEMMGLVPAIYQHVANTPGAGAENNTSFSCEPFIYESGDTVTFQPNPVFSLDLSKTSCSLPDGKERTGKIEMRLTGKFKKTGSQAILKFSNYLAGGLLYTCDSMMLYNRGSNISYYAFDVKLKGGICSTSSYTIRYNCDKVMAVYPMGDETATGAVSSHYGTAEGVTRDGLTFSVMIKNDIVKHNACRYFEQGKVIISPNGFKERLLDFGNGGCDEQAVFAVNENTVSFKLK